MKLAFSIKNNLITPFIANCLLFFFLLMLSPVLLITSFFNSTESSLIFFIVLYTVLIFVSYLLPSDKEKEML
jgi:hypothetical protein